MRKDKEQAILLRKSGMTYSDIKSRLGIPRSTLSKWFKDQAWSNDIARRTAQRVQKDGAIRFAVMNTIRAGRLANAYKQARQDAILDFEEMRYHPLFIAGLMAYWMHGDMASRRRVCFSSSDPEKVRLFKLFLDRICGIQGPKAWIQLRQGNLIFLAESYWREKCGFAEGFMGKTIVSGRKIQEKLGKTRTVVGNNHGVCNIAVNSAYLKSKILKWIELAKTDLLNEGYLNESEVSIENSLGNNAGIV